MGGNGTGKSTFLVNALILGLLLPRDKILNPWLKRCEFFTNRSKWANFNGPNGNHSLALLMRRDPIENVFIPTLQKWAPRDSFHVDRSDKHFAHKISFEGGGLLTLYSTDQDVSQMSGPNYDGVMADEPFPITWYNESLKRSRGKGFFISVMTPVFDTNAGMFVDMIDTMPEKSRVKKMIHLYSVCKKRGVRGFREKRLVDADENSTPPEYYDACICGKPMYLAGKVFKSFNAVVNCISESEAIDAIRANGATWYVSCDPHGSLPHLVGFFAILGDGRMIWVEEWPRWDPGVQFNMKLEPNNWLEYFLHSRPEMFHKLHNFGLKNSDQFVRLVKTIEKGILDKYCGVIDERGVAEYEMVGTKITRRYVDPRAGNTKTYQSNLTLVEAWRKAGLIFFPAGGNDADPTKQQGEYEKINTLLGGSLKDDGAPDKTPMIFFVENRCQMLIYHIANVAYEAEMKKGAFTGTIAETVNKNYKHGADVVRYAIRMRPSFVKPDHIKAAESKPIRPKEMFQYV